LFTFDVNSIELECRWRKSTPPYRYRC
jgi:hypothetical protein